MMMATTLEQNPELLSQYEENYESSKVVQILRFLKDQEKYTAERRAQAARPPAYVRLDERTEQERRRDGFRPRTADSAMFAPNYRPPRGRSSERTGTESPALSKARTNALTVSKIRGAANPGRPKLSRTPREQLDFSPCRENSRATIATRPATQQGNRVSYRPDFRSRLYSHPPPTRQDLIKDKHILEKRQSLLNRPKMTIDGGEVVQNDSNAIVQYDNNVMSVRLSRSTSRLEEHSRGVHVADETVVRSSTKPDSAGFRTLSATKSLSTEFSADKTNPVKSAPISIDDLPVPEDYRPGGDRRNSPSPARSHDRPLLANTNPLTPRKPLQLPGTDSSGSGGRVDVYHLPRLGHERAAPQPLPYLVETNPMS